MKQHFGSSRGRAGLAGRLLALMLALLGGAQWGWGEEASTATPAKKKYRVGIAQIVEHEALDAIRLGVMETLAQKKLLADTEVDYFNAQGNMVTLNQISKNLISQSPNAIVAIGTSAAQAAINRNHHIPVVFAPVTDPVGAKLVKDLQKPGGIATGSSDFSPIKAQLELIQKIIPAARKIAIIFNPGEANSVYLAEKFSLACKELQLTPVLAPVQSTAMVLTTARTISADAIYVPTDNTVASAIAAVIKAGLGSKTPVFAADVNLVKKGAVAALTVDYEELGRITGEILAEVLSGQKKPADMPVRFLDKPKLAINKKGAEAWGLQIPAAVMTSADIVF